MIDKIIIKMTIDDEGSEYTNDFIFKGDELTSSVSKAIIFLQEQQQEELKL